MLPRRHAAAPRGACWLVLATSCACIVLASAAGTGRTLSSVACPEDQLPDPDGLGCISRCPPGFVLNHKRTSCVCPPGLTLNEEGSKCVPSCPPGFVLDSQDKCSCPFDDEVPNPDGTGCEKRCPDTFTLNRKSDKCECPDGWHMDRHGKKCNLHCLYGLKPNPAGDACVCPADDLVLRKDGKGCELRCADGYVLSPDGEKCECPTGTVPRHNGKGCRESTVSMADALGTNPDAYLMATMCPPTFVLGDNDECVCPDDTEKSADGLVCILRCPPGFVLSSDGDLCLCPLGSVPMLNGKGCRESTVTMEDALGPNPDAYLMGTMCPPTFVLSPDDECVCADDMEKNAERTACVLRCPPGFELSEDGEQCHCPPGSVPKHDGSGCRQSTVPMDVALGPNPDAELMATMCPPTFMLSADDECVCPDDTEKNADGTVCVLRCAPGFELNEDGDRCHCPPGSVPKHDGSGCRQSTVPMDVALGPNPDAALMATMCPPTFMLGSDDECVCPDDTEKNADGTMCVLRCAPGFELNEDGDRCHCPPGTVPKHNGSGCRESTVSMAVADGPNPDAQLMATMCAPGFVLSSSDECVCPDDTELDTTGTQCQPACPSPFIYSMQLKICICPDGQRRVTPSSGIDECHSASTEVPPSQVVPDCAEGEYMTRNGACKPCFWGSVPNEAKTGCVEPMSPSPTPPTYESPPMGHPPPYPNDPSFPNEYIPPSEGSPPVYVSPPMYGSPPVHVSPPTVPVVPSPPTVDCPRNMMKFRNKCIAVCDEGYVLFIDGSKCVPDSSPPPPSWEMLHPPPSPPTAEVPPATSPPTHPPTKPPTYTPMYPSPSPPVDPIVYPPPTSDPPSDMTPPDSTYSPPIYSSITVDRSGADAGSSIQDDTAGSQPIITEEGSSTDEVSVGVIAAVAGLAVIALLASAVAYRSYTQEAKVASGAGVAVPEPTSPAVTGLPPDVELPAHVVLAETMTGNGYPGYDHQEAFPNHGSMGSQGYPGASTVAGMV